MEIKNYILEKCVHEVLEDMKSGKYNKLRASGLGACKRKLWYGVNRYKTDILNSYEKAEDKDAWVKTNASRFRFKLVFGLGDKIEEQLLEVLGDKIKDAQKEVYLILDGLELKGHIDGIYTDEEGYDWIVDFKSINTRSFKYNIQNKKLIDYKYLCQANFYMKALGIPRFRFVYYNKDTSHLEELFCYQDDKIYNDLIDRVKIAKNKNKPDKDYHPCDKTEGWNCTYCDYFNTCWEGQFVIEITNGKPEVKECSNEN